MVIGCMINVDKTVNNTDIERFAPYIFIFIASLIFLVTSDIPFHYISKYTHVYFHLELIIIVASGALASIVIFRIAGFYHRGTFLISIAVSIIAALNYHVESTWILALTICIVSFFTLLYVTSGDFAGPLYLVGQAVFVFTILSCAYYLFFYVYDRSSLEYLRDSDFLGFMIRSRIYAAGLYVLIGVYFGIYYAYRNFNFSISVPTDKSNESKGETNEERGWLREVLDPVLGPILRTLGILEMLFDLVRQVGVGTAHACGMVYQGFLNYLLNTTLRLSFLSKLAQCVVLLVLTFFIVLVASEAAALMQKLQSDIGIFSGGFAWSTFATITGYGILSIFIVAAHLIVMDYPVDSADWSEWKVRRIVEETLAAAIFSFFTIWSALLLMTIIDGSVDMEDFNFVFGPFQLLGLFLIFLVGGATWHLRRKDL